MAFRIRQNAFSAGATGGAHDAPQTPWSARQGTPLPIATPLTSFGASILSPLALATRRFARLGLGVIAPNYFSLELRLFDNVLKIKIVGK